MKNIILFLLSDQSIVAFAVNETRQRHHTRVRRESPYLFGLSQGVTKCKEVETLDEA